MALPRLEESIKEGVESPFFSHPLQVLSVFLTSLHKMTRLFNFTLISALAAIVSAQTLNVVNKCQQSVFLNTVSSSGTIANDVTLAAGATRNMGISSNWNGAINVGKYLDSMYASNANLYVLFLLSYRNGLRLQWFLHYWRSDLGW